MSWGHFFFNFIKQCYFKKIKNYLSNHDSPVTIRITFQMAKKTNPKCIRSQKNIFDRILGYYHHQHRRHET
jgi:hypothetical protein